MAIRSLSDALYAALAWLPLLAAIVGIGFFVSYSVVFVEREAANEGSEYFVENGASADYYNAQDIAEHRAGMAAYTRRKD